MVKSSVTVLAEAHGRNFAAYHADCVSFAEQMPSDSIDMSVYSPPFANLFVYSDSVCDFGNCNDDEQFGEQYRFLVNQIYRMHKPGTISCVHCCDLSNFKWKNGEQGFRDFPGDIIRLHQDAGFCYHCRVTIWKDPVTEMQRTKAHGLLHKTLKKDSCKSRTGNPDYILVFRKDGDRENPVSHSNQSFPVDKWQEWASPVWTTVDQGNTLNKEGAREEKDERHICPLQLDVIERCVVLWSNPGETVYSPFMGIGSEGYQAINYKRKFIGTELKKSYFETAVAYLSKAESESESLFDK